MKLLIAGLAAVWAIANLVGALVLLVNGAAAKTAAKGIFEQALMLLGALLVMGLAALLIWQCWQLLRSGPEPG